MSPKFLLIAFIFGICFSCAFGEKRVSYMLGKRSEPQSVAGLPATSPVNVAVEAPMVDGAKLLEKKSDSAMEKRSLYENDKEFSIASYFPLSRETVETPVYVRLCFFSGPACPKQDPDSCLIVKNGYCAIVPEGNSVLANVVGNKITAIYYQGRIDCTGVPSCINENTFEECFGLFASSKRAVDTKSVVLPAAEVVDVKPEKVLPINEAQPVQAQPVESKPVESTPVEAQPVESKPVEALPVAAKPAETTNSDIQPVASQPVAGETKQESTEKINAVPAQSSNVAPSDATNQVKSILEDPIPEDMEKRLMLIQYRDTPSTFILYAKYLPLHPFFAGRD